MNQSTSHRLTLTLTLNGGPTSRYESAHLARTDACEGTLLHIVSARQVGRLLLLWTAPLDSA